MAHKSVKQFLFLCILTVILLIVNICHVWRCQSSQLPSTSTLGLEGETYTMASASVYCPCPSPDLEEVKVKNIIMAMETNEDLLIKFFWKNNLKAKKGLGRRRETLDPEFEVPLFGFPPLRHSVCLPDHNRSEVHLLTSADKLSVGSPVQFRIDLYNGCGQPRFTGGDEIRAWLKSQNGKSAVAARVKDLHNGSYVGETILPWPGVTLVRVSLTYAREFLQMSVKLYHTLHSMRWTTETMQSEGMTERVPCLPFSPIPGYAKACNFTAGNGGRPWYCGHPVTVGLNCSHRRIYDNLPYTHPLPVPAELEYYVRSITSCCPNEKNADLRMIPNDVILDVPHETAVFPTPPLPPCSTRPVSESWLPPSPSSPRGWFLYGHWYPSTCTLPPLTKNRVQRCLTNRTFLLHGDSNQRALWQLLQQMLGCTKQHEWHWNAPHVCVNAALRSTLIQISHELPFSPGTHGKFPISNLALPHALNFSQFFTNTANNNNDSNFFSNNDNIDTHPDNNNDDNSANMIVVLHYYLHPSTHTVQVYRNLVLAACRTVQEYLKMHPKAKFVVRGPHVMYQGNQHLVHIGDKFAPWYQRIWQQEFADLRDRVLYLDTWDMTLAAENVLGHPLTLGPEIVRMLVGYICDDDD